MDELQQWKDQLAWTQSDEAHELFKQGRITYPEVTEACLRRKIAQREADIAEADAILASGDRERLRAYLQSP